jgi:hypothetical protein
MIVKSDGYRMVEARAEWDRLRLFGWQYRLHFVMKTKSIAAAGVVDSERTTASMMKGMRQVRGMRAFAPMVPVC